MKVGKPGRVSIMIAHIHPASTLDTVQDFLCRVGHETKYRTHAIITSSLYIFYPIFHCGLYCRAVSVTDNLCTKQGNS